MSAPANPESRSALEAAIAKNKAAGDWVTTTPFDSPLPVDEDKVTDADTFIKRMGKFPLPKRK